MFGNHARAKTLVCSLSLIAGLVAPACADPAASSPRADDAKPDEGSEAGDTETGDAGAAPRAEKGHKKGPGAPHTKPPKGPVGEIKAGVTVSFADLLNRTPEEVVTKLGEPTKSGKGRISCVRFVPNRIFFACDVVVASYADPNEKVETIQIEFEDGRAAKVAFASLPGEGEFDPRAALELVGLVLPGEPKHSQPAEVMSEDPVSVDLYSWFNSEARLLHEGYEYRVEVSVVDQKWERAKVQVIINHPLNADQTSRIKASKNPSAIDKPPEPANASEMPG